MLHKTISKKFSYVRISNRGNLYDVTYTVTVEKGRVIISDCEFSIGELFRRNLPELHEFIVEAMEECGYVIRREKNRENHGHPTHPINSGGKYYAVDGKLYRYDKNLFFSKWSAPISDVRRILDALMDGIDDHGYLKVPEI